MLHGPCWQGRIGSKWEEECFSKMRDNFQTYRFDCKQAAIKSFKDWFYKKVSPVRVRVHFSLSLSLSRSLSRALSLARALALSLRWQAVRVLPLALAWC
jgi:hypothetical protein